MAEAHCVQILNGKILVRCHALVFRVLRVHVGLRLGLALAEIDGPLVVEEVLAEDAAGEPELVVVEDLDLPTLVPPFKVHVVPRPGRARLGMLEDLVLGAGRAEMQSALAHSEIHVCAAWRRRLHAWHI